MNEILLQYLPKLEEVLKAGVAYGTDLFSRIIKYVTFTTLGKILMCFFALIICGIIGKLLHKWYKKVCLKEEYESFVDACAYDQLLLSAIITYIIFSTTIVILSIVYIIDGTFNIIKINTVPELYIVEYLQDLKK